MKEKVAISWSGGKDCALALFEIRQSKKYEALSLHTVFNLDTNRVGLHGIKQYLIEQQAQSLGIPLDKIFIPSTEDHAAYENAMHKYYQPLGEAGIRTIVFGDIFLEDLKAYREKMLSSHGLIGVFPLWKANSQNVAEKFIGTGFKAIICAVDARYFSKSDVGREYDLAFIESLPVDVDPCGENGEFHTFVYDGPVFDKPVSFERHWAEAKKYSFKVKLPNGQSESRTSTFWFQELS